MKQDKEVDSQPIVEYKNDRKVNSEAEEKKIGKIIREKSKSLSGLSLEVMAVDTNNVRSISHHITCS